MSSRWSNPVNNNRLLDKENNVLLGGYVEFFAADTSTPLAVYSDPELTVSLGSVITADAFGLLPDFHLAAGTQYKAAAKDSLGAEKWTRDYVFSLDTNVDERLDSIEASINNSAASRNLLVNGGMRVNDGVAATLSSSLQIGSVNTVYGSVDNVTAGTLTQGATTDYRSGKYLDFNAVTTSGAGFVVAQIRVPSGTAASLVDTAAAFSAKVRHDVGSNVTYTIKFQIPSGAADDFSSLSTLFTSAGQSVATDTDTLITLATADIGDVSKGIAIEISASIAAVSGRQFRITEAQLEPGSINTAFTEAIFETASTSAGSHFPVGSIYLNATNGTNPATLLGFGVWDEFGQGRVLMGDGNAGITDSFDAVAGATRGAYKHTLTESEIPAHTHGIDRDEGLSGGANNPTVAVGGVSLPGTDATTRSTGGGGSHTNEQPSIVVYMWVRVG